MADQNKYVQLPEGEEAKTKVIKGSAQVGKKNISKKMVDFLISDKIDTVVNYLTYTILGPSLKDLIFKMGTGALQMALFGGQGGQQYPPMGYNAYNNYGYSGARRDSTMYSQLSQPTQYPSYPGYAQPQPGPYQQRVGLNDVSFDTKDDAYLVLDRMNHDIARYGKVRVADFYTYSGISGQEGNWTLQGNGWYSLQGVQPIMRTDGRWIIDFPPIQPIR